MRRCAKRAALALAAAALVAGAAAPVALAGDLLVLQGEEVRLAGSQSYGIVYVDGTVRLAGDTSITASSVYIGPNAYLATCFVDGAGDNGCTNGRSLTIRSASQLTIASSIDLTGGTGPSQAGGSLDLSGAQVALGGSVNTSGSGGAPSGSVTLASSGPLDVGAVTALSAAVRVSAGGDLGISGDISTYGSDQTPQGGEGRAQDGGPVDVASSGGDVEIRGNVFSGGRDVGPAGPGGGAGGPVTITGGDVRVGAVDAMGGASVDAGAGPSAPIRIAARGTLHVLGRLDAGGQNSTNSTPVGGSDVRVSAGGGAVLAGGASVAGGSGRAGNAGAGGAIEVRAASAVLGPLSAWGGNASAAPSQGSGGGGGTITVASPGPVSLGAVLAYGGSAPDLAEAGAGGTVDVAGGSISTGPVSTAGGRSNGGSGRPGGRISLSAETSLDVGGAISSEGSAGVGDATPPRPGGAGGPILLRAATGTLRLGAPVRAQGGRGAGDLGAGRGAAGGAGGAVDVVARTLGGVVAISSAGGDGGDYGDTQGPGGAGADIRAWTDGPLFDDLKVVMTDGGAGNPEGAAGLRQQQSSPTNLVLDPAGTLSFTSRSPGAQGYRVLRSAAGTEPKVIAETKATSGIRFNAPTCVPVTFTVVAFHRGVGWTSEGPAPVPYTEQPSARQRCVDAPRLRSRARVLRVRLKTLRRAKWKLGVRLRSSGIGSVRGQLLRARRGLTTFDAPVTAGATRLRLNVPRTARRAGRYRLRLVTLAPDGKARATTTLKLEVRR